MQLSLHNVIAMDMETNVSGSHEWITLKVKMWDDITEKDGRFEITFHKGRSPEGFFIQVDDLVMKDIIES